MRIRYLTFEWYPPNLSLHIPRKMLRRVLLDFHYDEPYDWPYEKDFPDCFGWRHYEIWLTIFSCLVVIDWERFVGVKSHEANTA